MIGIMDKLKSIFLLTTIASGLSLLLFINLSAKSNVINNLTGDSPSSSLRVKEPTLAFTVSVPS